MVTFNKKPDGTLLSSSASGSGAANGVQGPPQQYGAIPMREPAGEKYSSADGGYHSGGRGGGGGGGGGRDGGGQHSHRRDGVDDETTSNGGVSPERAMVVLGAVAIAVIILGGLTAAIWEKKAQHGPVFGWVPNDMAALMDKTVDPCTDFYAFACDGYMSTHKSIPDSKIKLWPAFDTIHKRIADATRSLLQHDSGNAGVFYRSCLDVKTVDSLGVTPLKPWVDRIMGMRSRADVTRVVAALHGIKVAAFFYWGIDIDPNNPNKHSLALTDDGTTLPEPKYYNSKAKQFVHHRTVFLGVVRDMLARSGVVKQQDLNTAVSDVMAVEQALAHATLSPDAYRLAKPKVLSLSDLDRLTPSFHWKDYLTSLGAVGGKGGKGGKGGGVDFTITTKDTRYLHGVEQLFSPLGNGTIPLSGVSARAVALRRMQHYLVFRVAYTMGDLLDNGMYEIGMRLQTEITGQKERVARPKKCYDAAKDAMVDAVAELYLSSQRLGPVRLAAESLVAHIRAALTRDLSSVAWMGAKTRASAMKKLKGMFVNIGQGKLQSYGFEVSPHSFANNTNSARAWAVSQQLGRLHETVKRRDWGSTSPLEDDAFYARHVNGLFLPYGILQSPLFDAKFPPSRNYGALGTIIGHEMTHGFDDNGRKYDSAGQRNPWWSAKDVANFDARSQCIANTYSSYSVNGRKVDGKLTLGEAIADIGGLGISYRAYTAAAQRAGAVAGAGTRQRHYHQQQEQQQHDVDQDKLFFLSWAQTWCSVTRGKALRMALLTDEHPPDKFRVNGPVSQHEAFAKVFQCRAGQAMAPHHMCTLW